MIAGRLSVVAVAAVLAVAASIVAASVVEPRVGTVSTADAALPDAGTFAHVLAVGQQLAASLDPLLPLNPAALLHAYLTSNALLAAFGIVLLLGTYSFVVTEITGNYSSVDRLWSIVPALYVWHFALRGAGDRVLVMAALATAWGARLTYNFYRKGGFSGEEDYRWPELRKIIGNKWLFRLFNLTFISFYQHFLLLAFVLPAYLAGTVNTAAPLNTIDYAAVALFLALLVLETTADQQQWNFQEHKLLLKLARKPLTGDAKLGFLTHGLFRFSRHPNFFAEQAMWWTFYLFSVAATGEWLNWSLTGAVLLSLLFQGSTDFTEKLTLGRYPDYAAYQRTTSRLVPWLPGPEVAPRA